MRRLAAPLRLAWDFAWPPIARPAGAPRRPPPDVVRAVGAEIVRAQVLLLEVGYPDAEALRSGELVQALAGFSGSLSIVLEPATAAGLGAEKPWEALGAAEVWLDATPVEAVVPEGAGEAWPAVRYHLTARNPDAVAAALVRAVERGAGAVSLPNLPLFGDVLRDARALAPRPEQLRGFAARVAPALRSRPGIDLRVHHYGLWEELRALGLAPHAEEAPGAAGCQAGAALAYVDPAGILYPCASLPLPLGRIDEGALTRVWAGEELRALRALIAGLPTACGGCRAEKTCRGGCRGWAQYLAGAWDATGPDCTRL